MFLSNHIQSKNALHDQVEPAASNPVIQTKLAIGAVNDPLETEADTVADKVMSMSALPSQVSSTNGSVQRKCDHCEEEEKAQRKPLTSFIQAKGSPEGGVASDGLTGRISASKGNGAGMDATTQHFMEARFGADFSSVNIHTGTESIQMNRELNAKAFTVGNNIYFNEGQYSPSTNDGKHLLAHELTHTLQQSQSLQTKKIQRSASTCTYGEVRQWAIVSQSDLTAPAGLSDAKASIGAACSRGQPCNCVDGSTHAKAAGDKAAWANINAASGGTDLSGGGNFMCVGSENCWFVHECAPVFQPGQKRPPRRARTTNLVASGTVTLNGHTIFFYNDPRNGNC